MDECYDKIQYYLQHEPERQRIARAGYQLAHECYSYDRMVETIVDDIREYAKG
jgi:spore maturation protein CgeB